MSEHGADAVGFPAFPASRRRPGRFARTWWGQEWLRAVTETALDTEPLRLGRRHAHSGRVGPITVSPGRLAAQVFDEDGAFHTIVIVDPLTDSEWHRFLDEVEGKAGHIAALLDRDMPQDLVEAAADADVPLLPGLGDLRGECDCDDWELCRHAAALCYQAAWLLDADPFVLLLLRGRPRGVLTDELRARKKRAAGETGEKSAPVPSGTGRPPRLPELPPISGPPVPLTVPPAPGIDPAELAAVAGRAAERARNLLLRSRSGAESEAVQPVDAALEAHDQHPS